MFDGYEKKSFRENMDEFCQRLYYCYNRIFITNNRSDLDYDLDYLKRLLQHFSYLVDREIIKEKEGIR